MVRLGCSSALSNGNRSNNFCSAWGTALALHTLSWSTALLSPQLLWLPDPSSGQAVGEEPLQDIAERVWSSTDLVRCFSHLQIKNLMPGTSSAMRMSQESKPVTIFWHDFLAIAVALFITQSLLFIACVLQHSALCSCFWSLAYLPAVWPSLLQQALTTGSCPHSTWQTGHRDRAWWGNPRKHYWHYSSRVLPTTPSCLEAALCPALFPAKV